MYYEDLIQSICKAARLNKYGETISIRQLVEALAENLSLDGAHELVSELKQRYEMEID